MNVTTRFLSVALAFTAGAIASAQNPAGNPGDQPVSREEYNRLLKELEAIKARLGAAEEQTRSRQVESDQTFSEFERTLAEAKNVALSARAGSSKFLVTGYGFTGFTDPEGAASTFSAGLNPLFLWKYGDRVLFESELELELEDGETELALEYAHLTFLLNDYITLGAGRFLTPFGTFAERLHPAWINKLPDAPLPFRHHGGFVPMTSLGVDVRGGIPLGLAKMNYSLYVSNGPRLETEGHHLGDLEFDNFPDADNNKAVGGRLGFLPIPELEVGYSFQYARVDASGTSADKADVFLQSVDLGYVRDSESLRGMIDLRGQWVWSSVDDLIYTDEDGDPFTFDNERSGGYAQIAYRSSKWENKFLQNLEYVFRYGWVDQPAGVRFNENRYTVGLNYWLTPSMVVKAAYQVNDRDRGRDDQRAYLLQAAIGF